MHTTLTRFAVFSSRHASQHQLSFTDMSFHLRSTVYSKSFKFWRFKCQTQDIIMRHAVVWGSGKTLTTWYYLTCTQCTVHGRLWISPPSTCCRRERDLIPHIPWLILQIFMLYRDPLRILRTVLYSSMKYVHLLLVHIRDLTIRADSVSDTRNKRRRKGNGEQEKKEKGQRWFPYTADEQRRLAKGGRSRRSPWRQNAIALRVTAEQNIENVSVWPIFSVFHVLPRAFVGNTLNIKWRSSASKRERTSPERKGWLLLFYAAELLKRHAAGP